MTEPAQPHLAAAARSSTAHPSPDLLAEVLEPAVAKLAVVDAAVRAAPDDQLESVDAMVRAVFRPAFGVDPRAQPPPGEQAERLRASVEPLVERAIAFLAAEMDVGRLRRGDPCLAALAETLRRVG